MGIKKPSPKDPWPDPPEVPVVSDEELGVRRHRYRQARRAGLSFAESHLFAASDADVGVLRFLAAKQCPTDLIAKILI